jgi:uncharacterized damage-inducible protein DinB
MPFGYLVSMVAVMPEWVAMMRRRMISDTRHHWVHHRGEMTVYLRLLGSKVPALYGPSADDRDFQ